MKNKNILATVIVVVLGLSLLRTTQFNKSQEPEINSKPQIEILEETKKEIEAEAKAKELEAKIKQKEVEKLNLEIQKEEIITKTKKLKDIVEDQSLKRENKNQTKVQAVETKELKLESKIEPKKSTSVDNVMSYLSNKNHRYTKEYVNLIYNACDQDSHCLYSIIAVSGHESVYGTLGRANDGTGKDNNFWGWFKGGNKNYDPDKKTMAKAIAVGFKKGGRYYAMINPETKTIRQDLVVLYSGNDRANIWARNVLSKYVNLISIN